MREDWKGWMDGRRRERKGIQERKRRKGGGRGGYELADYYLGCVDLSMRSVTYTTKRKKESPPPFLDQAHTDSVMKLFKCKQHSARTQFTTLAEAIYVVASDRS